MLNLKCHDYTCVHNCAGCCSQEGIDVSVKANCLTYCRNAYEKTREELAADIRIPTCNSKTEIRCHDCECTNNKDCRCVLNNLCVDRVDGVPLCTNRRYPH